MFGKEKKNETTKPMKACIYPRCNECEHYQVKPSDGINEAFATCDVPIVITKQMYHDVEFMLDSLSDRIDTLDAYLTDLHAFMKERATEDKAEK